MIMKISEHRAGLFKHMLSLILTIVMLVSVPGPGSFAAADGVGTDHCLTDTDMLSQDLINETESNSSTDSSSSNTTPALAPDESGPESQTDGGGETGGEPVVDPVGPQPPSVSYYILEKDESVGDKWIIGYTYTYYVTEEGKDEPVDVGGSGTLENNTSASIIVGATVKLTLTPKTSPVVPLTLTSNKVTESLMNKVTESSGIYIYNFTMPASTVTVSADWKLYLNEGDIELTPQSFKQNGGQEAQWNGDYRIMQTSSDTGTPHVLKLSGDFTKEPAPPEKYKGKIFLDDLTNAGNSIELEVNSEEGTKVVLTQEGKIEVKNILVPSGTELTLNGNYNPEANQTTEEASNTDKKNITLTPGADWAAIGGSRATGEDQKNGTITLENVDLTMVLGGTSGGGFGIGPGSLDEGAPCGDITVNGSKITVTTVTGPSGQKVYALYGNTVTLDSCEIGSKESGINSLIYAEKNLKIKKCQIYQ